MQPNAPKAKPNVTQDQTTVALLAIRRFYGIKRRGRPTNRERGVAELVMRLGKASI